MNRQKAKATLEAILFTMGDSVEIDRLAEVIEEDKKVTKEPFGTKVLNGLWRIKKKIFK